MTMAGGAALPASKLLLLAAVVFQALGKEWTAGLPLNCASVLSPGAGPELGPALLAAVVGVVVPAV